MKIIALNKIPWVFKISVIFLRYLLIPWVFQVFQARLNPVMHCLIWYRLYNLKNEKNTHVGMLHSLKCNTNGTKWREVSHIHTTDLCIILNMIIKLFSVLIFLSSSLQWIGLSLLLFHILLLLFDLATDFNSVSNTTTIILLLLRQFIYFKNFPVFYVTPSNEH